MIVLEDWVGVGVGVGVVVGYRGFPGFVQFMGRFTSKIRLHGI